MTFFTYVRKPSVIVLAVSIILNAIVWLMAWQFMVRHEEAIILHYNIDVGVDLLGEDRHIIMLPTAGTLLVIVNGIVGGLLQRVDTRAAWALWGTLPIVHLVLIGTIILLWRINA